MELVNSKLKIEGYYGIGTNATIPNPSKDIKIVIKNSSIETFGTENGDNTAVLFNVQGSVKITDGSTITGDRQAVILRGGEGHIIKDSTLKTSGKYDKEGEYTNGKRGPGNEVPLAALVVGNRSTSAYDYKTSVELENVIIDAPEKNAATNAKDYYAIYVWQNNTTNTVSVTGTVKFAETNNKVNTDKMNDATYTVKVIE